MSMLDSTRWRPGAQLLDQHDAVRSILDCTHAGGTMFLPSDVARWMRQSRDFVTGYLHRLTGEGWSANDDDW